MTSQNRIPLGRALIEGGVIVVSILLAFGIDAGWDRFQEREAEREALRTLAAEFSTNLEMTRVGIRGNRRNRSNTVFVLESLRSSRTGAQLQIPDTSIVYMLTIGSLNPSTGALDGVLGSQGLDLFSDPILRSRLASWPGHLRDVLEDQAGGQAFALSNLIGVLGRHGDLSSAMEAAGAHLQDRATEEELSNATDFIPSTELLSMLGMHIVLLDRSFFALGALEGATEEILSLLPPA